MLTIIRISFQIFVFLAVLACFHSADTRTKAAEFVESVFESIHNLFSL